MDAFGELTGDRNPIHVDPGYAATTPFGGTIVHGYLTLSLLAPIFNELIEVRGAEVGLNYGLNRVRFPRPLPVGAEFRGTGRVLGTKAIEGGVELETELSIEVRGSERPALVAVCLSRFYS